LIGTTPSEWLKTTMRQKILAFGLAILCAYSVAISLFPPRGFAVSGERTDRPHRVIIYPPVLGGYATIDDGCDHIVGASNFETDGEARNDPIHAAYPCLEQVPPMVTFPRGTAFPTDPEQVLLRAPDNIVVWNGTGEALKAAGLPLFAINSLRPPAGALQSWKAIGALAGQSARAEHMLQYTEAMNAEALGSLEKLSGPKPSFLLMWSFDGSKTFHLGPSFYGPAFDLERLRTINLAPRGRVGRVDIEELLLSDPDVIFLRNQPPETLYDAPAFSALKAVRERKVYQIPAFGQRLDRFVPDQALFLRWALELLYPEEMTGTRKRLRDLYQEIFNVKLDEQTLDMALLIKENEQSLNYGRFRRN
jgi:iron complex transport system substrate-binding protein